MALRGKLGPEQVPAKHGVSLAKLCLLAAILLLGCRVCANRIDFQEGKRRGFEKRENETKAVLSRSPPIRRGSHGGGGPVQELCEEASCSICLEFFRDPVMIAECGHTFCRACLTLSWGESGAAEPSCPQCRGTAQPQNLRPNPQLANLVEIAKKVSPSEGEGAGKGGEGEGGVCEKHGEPLKFFCREDRAPLCVVCSRSREHRGHRVTPLEEEAKSAGEKKATVAARKGSICQKHQEPLKLFCRDHEAPICVVCEQSQEHRYHDIVPVEEASQEYKDQFCTYVQILQKEKNKVLTYKASLVKESQDLLRQTKGEQQKMLTQFRQLHTFLDKQEKLLLAQMDEVEKEVARNRDQHLAEISEELSALESLIREMEEKSQWPASDLLQDARSTLQRARFVRVDLMEVPDQIGSVGYIGWGAGRKKEAWVVTIVGCERRDLSGGNKMSHLCEYVYYDEDAGVPLGSGKINNEVHRDDLPRARRHWKRLQETWWLGRNILGPAADVAGADPMGVKAVKHLPYMLYVLWQGDGINQNVVQVNYHEPVKEVAEDIVHETLKYRGGVGTKEAFENPVAFPVALKWRIWDFSDLSPLLEGIKKQFKDTLNSGFHLQKANVTLDPDTAHPELILSERQKRVRREKAQALPNNPERFDQSGAVLGHEGFTAGRHFWEVLVGSEKEWAVGVARQSVSRKGELFLHPEKGIWAVRKLPVGYIAAKRGSPPLTLTGELKRIRVCLNYTGGRVAFFDAD
ncbi:PREDICTED: tripartite motif-containing protein 7-like [Gekko japonicus]|uniref:Tripartite motif-containing protein 7-like n=1 Tax=Gekko japonicus TaxID=146911 RepID=A0ABM1LFG5_GEKJA|nr:PREDICTED: tripartite motif-containing protein 7-like [Gekko japonicus]